MSTRRLIPLLAALSLLAFAVPANAKVFLGCRTTKTDDGKGMSLRVKPSRCNTLFPGQSFNEAANLGKLKWSVWGKHAARGSGVDLGFHQPYGDSKVSVRLSRPICRDSYGGKNAEFSRMRVTYEDGTIWKIKLLVQC